MPLIAISGSQGTGKAQPLTSHFLTPNGWLPFASAAVGMEVSVPSGKTAKITGVYPQGIRPIYRITTDDGGSCEADADHLWQVNVTRNTRSNVEGKWKTVYQRNVQVVTTLQLQQIVGKREARRNTKSGGWGKHVTIDYVSPVTFKQHSTLPIDPYVLGTLIGDGTLDSTPRITSTDEEIVLNIESRLTGGYCLNRIGESIEYLISHPNATRSTPNAYGEALEQLQLLGATSDLKFIPLKYLKASVNDRWQLLAGLMDTDGTVNKTGSDISYTTVSESLARDIQHLVRSLGGRARISQRTPMYKYKGEKRYGRLAYSVSIKFADNSNIFSLTRKSARVHSFSQNRTRGINRFERRIKSVDYVRDAPAVCISVDDPQKLYITDDFIVTHNTTLIDALPFPNITRKTSRSILSEWGVTLSQVNNDRPLTIKFQDEILKRKIEDEAVGVNSDELFITERTYADLFVYALVAIGKDNEYSNWLDDYYHRCAEAQSHYGWILYLTGGHFKPVNDGVRAVNQHYSWMVDTCMLEYTRRMSSDITSIIDTADLTKRIEHVTAVCNRFNQF